MLSLHPERYSTTGVLLHKLIVVVHDAETGDGAAASLLRALQSPGDRKLPDGRMYGSGYHAVTDGNGGYTELADARMGPYAAPPTNKTAWHVCMPGRANQTRDEWLDPLSRNHIRGVAQFVYDKHLVDGIPLDRLNPGQLLAGDRGYCAHADVSLAWHDSDHTDPGPNFPWDVLSEDIAALAEPPSLPVDPIEEDDMAPFVHIAIKDEPGAGQFMWIPGAGAPISYTDTDDRDALLKAAGIEAGATISRAMFDRLR